MAKGKYQRWLTDEGLLLLEGWARDGLTDEQISRKIGIRRETLYDWKAKYPNISNALKKGKDVIDIQVENALLKRALGYRFDEITMERIDDTGQNKRHDAVQELTEKDWEVAQAFFGYACAYCGKPGKLTKDHLNPLKNGGKLTKENTIPACGHCNSSKKDKDWLSWFQSQSFYDKGRAQKIADYISFALSLKGIEDKSSCDSSMVVTKVVTKEVIPDTPAQIFWLKNRRPDKWRNNPPTDADQEALKKLDAILEGIDHEAE